MKVIRQDSARKTLVFLTAGSQKIDQYDLKLP